MTQPRSAGEGQSWARAGRSPLFPSTRLPPEGPTANRARAVLCSRQAGGGLRSLKGGHLNPHQDRGEQGLQEDLHLSSRPHSASVSCVTSDDPGGLPSELPGPAALRVKPSWPASIWWAPGTPLGSSLMWPNCFPILGLWHVAWLLWALPSSPSCRVGVYSACLRGGGRPRVGWAVLRPGPGREEARWCRHALPLVLPPSSSTLPFSDAKYKTRAIHGHRRAWAAPDLWGQFPGTVVGDSVTANSRRTGDLVGMAMTQGLRLPVLLFCFGERHALGGRSGQGPQLLLQSLGKSPHAEDLGTT